MKSLSRKEITYLDNLIKEYRKLSLDKKSLLGLIDENEIAESVYNSNAIENSTMTLRETERILLEQETQSNLSLGEVYEAKNLKHVMEYVENHKGELNIELILLLHKLLLTNINNGIAGRLRCSDEYVKVDKHIAPAPEFIDELLGAAIVDYSHNTSHFLGAIAKFHLEFERIHPFMDGNGRIGRVLINFQLDRVGLPRIIIRNRNKQNDYYPTFPAYIEDGDTYLMEKEVYLYVVESLHKRLAYLNGKKIISLTHYAEHSDRPVRSLQNSAKSQTISAFRVDNEWSIGV